MTITLVGLPGSGKSTVGRHLARRLQVAFVDSDQVIEDRLRCSIKDYFAREGEGSFRVVESSVLLELVLTESCGVLSTGGGAVLSETNRAVLRKHSRVVYLNALPEELVRRLRHDTQRPLLQVADPLAALRELYRVRDPFYREIADWVVETSRHSAASLAAIIAGKLDAMQWCERGRFDASRH